MGKKGGSQPQQTYSQVSQSNLPEYARPYFERLMSRTEAESNQPYAMYPGQRIQGFNPDQQSAFQGYRNLAEYGNPTVDQGAGMARSAGQQALQSGRYQPQMVGTGQWSGRAANQYMDPYLQNVLDVQQRRATQRYGEQVGQLDSGAQKAKAFGGSRHGIQSALAQRDFNQQLGDAEAQAMSQAYQNAQQMFTSDQGRRLQARMANQQAGLQGAQLGIQGAQAGTAAAQALGQLGGAQQQLYMDRMKSLMGVGTAQQEQGQRALDLAREDFINQRDFERNNLAFMSGILRGVPVTPQSETITTAPGPNMLSQALGAGIAGSQLANMKG